MNKKLIITHDKLQTAPGFTLIEILLASYIFLVVVLAATAVFSSTIGAKMKASAFWQTQQEGRYAMEKIIKTIRLENVKAVKVSPTDHSILLLYKDTSYQTSSLIYRVRLTNKAIYLVNTSVSPNVIVCLTSANVKVSDLEFSGYYPTASSTQQPFVTIKMTVETANASKQSEKESLTLKTAVNLRNYGYKYAY